MTLLEEIKAELDTGPVSEKMFRYLVSHSRENRFLDFKYLIDISKGGKFAKYMKTIFAFTNTEGGWFVLGFAEIKPNIFVPTGLPSSFDLDQANLQEKVRSYCSDIPTLQYREFRNNFSDEYENLDEENDDRNILDWLHKESHRFGLIYVPGSTKLCLPEKDGIISNKGAEKTIFEKGELYVRRGTQSISPPSEFEKKYIQQRSQDRRYESSVVNGQPDKIAEKLFSNLLKIKEIPDHIYTAKLKVSYNNISDVLKRHQIFPWFYWRFRVWRGKMVIIDNIEDLDNDHRILIYVISIKKHNLREWMKDPDKYNIVISVLHKELYYPLIKKGLRYVKNNSRHYLYFAVENGKKQRKVHWKGGYKNSTRNVVYSKLKNETYTYFHFGVSLSILEFEGKYYLRIFPKLLASNDGVHVEFNSELGAQITSEKSSDNNSSLLNDTLFWIYYLFWKNKRPLPRGFGLELKPVQFDIDFGISHDLPSAYFKGVKHNYEN